MKCKNATAKDKVYRLADGAGLSLEVRPNGAKSFVYRYRIEGVARSISFGVYPTELSLVTAREELITARKLVKAGIDPVIAKRESKIKRSRQNALTFKAVQAEWYRKTQGNWKEK